jgi:hypothetical protein
MKHLTVRSCAALSLLVAVIACEPPVGDVVTCQKEWTCELAGVVSEDTDTFCTRPDDEDRPTDIADYQTEFAETCDSVQVDCGGEVFATCAAVCTTGGGECDVATAVRVRL